MIIGGPGRPIKHPLIWLATGALLCVSALLLLLWRPPALPQAFPPQVEKLDGQVWASGIKEFDAERYANFHQHIIDLRSRWRVESSRWWPSWTIDEFSAAYQKLLDEGADLLIATQRQKSVRRAQLARAIQQEQAQLTRLRALNGRFDLKGYRKGLSRAESLLTQALYHLRQEGFQESHHQLAMAQQAVTLLEAGLIQQMSRYQNAQNLTRWNRWVSDTVEQSKRTGGSAIVILKASQEFRLYRKGLFRRHYPIDLGFSGLQDKLHEGDGATPEGIFRITQKKEGGESKYYKAFLLDYPTSLHKRQFQTAKSRGLIPVHRGIGGLIEIHGQPPDRNDQTDGCIALDNSVMDALFSIISVGTPVVIVGALDSHNSITQTLEPILAHRTQRETHPSTVTSMWQNPVWAYTPSNIQCAVGLVSSPF